MMNDAPRNANVNSRTPPSSPLPFSPTSPSFADSSGSSVEVDDVDFLDDRGGSERYSFKSLVGELPDEDQSIQQMALSKYVSLEGLSNFLLEKKGEFTTMTLNADNLYAKHSKLMLLIKFL